MHMEYMLAIRMASNWVYKTGGGRLRLPFVDNVQVCKTKLIKDVALAM